MTTRRLLKHVKLEMYNTINFITQYFRSKLVFEKILPVSIYLFKFNNANMRTMCEICSKLTIKTPERHKLHCSGVFIVENISHIVIVFQMLILRK